MNGPPDPTEHCWGAALTGNTSAAVAAHLERCAHCQRLVQALTSVRKVNVEAIPAPAVDPTRRVLKHLRAERRAAAKERSKAASPLCAPPQARHIAGSSRFMSASAKALRLGDRGRLPLVAAAMTFVLVFAVALRPTGTGPRITPAVASSPFPSECDVTDRSLQNVGKPADAGRSAGQPIQVAGAWNGEEQARFVKVLERFERATGFQVVYRNVTHDIESVLKGRVEGGCPPAVALLPQPTLLRYFVDHQHLESLEPATAELVARNYGEQWRQLASVGDKSYGVWFKATHKSQLWHRLSRFDAARIKVPRTLQELEQLTDRLRAEHRAPFALNGADLWALTDWFENIYLSTAGPARYDELASGELRWTDPTVRRALAKLAALLGLPGSVAGGLPQALDMKLKRSVLHVFSPDQRSGAAMLSSGDFVQTFIPPQAQDDVGTFAFPSDTHSSRPVIVGGDVAVQFKKGANAASRALIYYLATPAAAEPWARAGGFISPNRKLDVGVYKNRLTRVLARSLKRSATPLRFDLSDLQPSGFGGADRENAGGMWRIFHDFFKFGPRSISETMERLEKAASAARDSEQANYGPG